jgi:hypothetical protein
VSGVPRIFISYNRSDGAADAGRLADWLRRKFGEENVFTDVVDIDFGANWERVVEHTLENVIAVLLVIGPAWSVTEPIKHELGVALDAGVAIIPVLVRGAEWAIAMRDLPPRLLPIQKFNAVKLDHGRWPSDIEPLLLLLERMLNEPDRARVICKPPDAIAVLQTRINTENVRSLLAAAADLAECLKDPSVLDEAKKLLPTASRGGPQWSAEKALHELVSLVKTARYRLMVEQIGHDLLKRCPGERIAQYIGEPKLEESINLCRKYFEEEKEEWSRTRGDSGNPNETFRSLIQEEEKVRVLLRNQLPGITRNDETRSRLYDLVQDQLRRVFKRKSIDDYFEYCVIKNFTSFPDMEFQFREESNLPQALEMLKRYERSA